MGRIAVITDYTVGGTFLSWSLQWLSGQDMYFYSKQNTYIKITDNPLTNKNSHNFRPNQARTLSDVEKLLSILPTHSTQHIYFHLLSIKGRYSNENVRLDTNEAINLAVKNCDHVVTLKLNEEYALYHCSLSRRETLETDFDTGELLEDLTDTDAIDAFIDFFFKDSLAIWQSQNLIDIWDRREFIALNFRPLATENFISSVHLFDFDHYDLPAHECWITLDSHIENVLRYCNVQIDYSKFDHWLSVYNQWKQLHQDRIKFCQSFNTIINSILSDQPMDLAEFNLDIVREAAIQHALIYNHNLNLKTWRLEKFTNTRQLHNLLEPNIHSLSS